MNIEGVPESIEWAKVRDFLESIGLPLNRIPAHHGGIVIAGNHIKATIHAVNDKGERYADRSPEGGSRIATHEVCIPITDAPFQRMSVDEAAADKLSAAATTGHDQA